MGAKIKGLDQLVRKLDRLAKKDARKAMRRAVAAGTAIVRSAVRAETPVDEGQLRKAQASKVSGRGFGVSGRVGADVAKLNADAAASDGKRPANIDWLVEEGHTAPDGTFIPPSGYMRRAADASLPRAHAALVSRLAEEIEKAA